MINVVITLAIGFVYYYFLLPPINLQDISFYVFLGFLLFIYGLLDLGSNTVDFIKKGSLNIDKKFNTIILLPIMFLVIGCLNFFVSPLFDSKGYASRIQIDESGNFSEDIDLVDFKKAPLLDKSSSQKLGDRTMGEMSDLVSQYYVSEIYSQINYKEEIVRVTPLEYADIIKFFSNHKEGIKGYIIVNSVTGDANVVRLEEGMKYVPSAILQKDMMRHLRLKYPTVSFGSYSFEIDDEGSPYFIIPKIKYTMVGLRRDIDGVIVLDPITGETENYDLEDVPQWIDHVYEPDMIIEQTDDWGTYRGGFWNSVFAQKNVVNTTDGYNYLAMDGDIFLYTGITSIQSDESNLGFILTNMRTKKTIFYSAPGAEEYSAMASAEGQVQEMKYTSTFPLLINLNDRPTYLVSLKDDAGLVKKYAFIDVQDYQKVTVTDSSLGIEKAAQNYLSSYKLDGGSKNLEDDVKIASISTAIIEGNTQYYFVSDKGNKYSVSISVAPDILPFIKVGSTIHVSYTDGEVKIIKDIEYEES